MGVKRIHKLIINIFLKKWTKEYCWDIKVDQNNLRLLFLVFIADYLAKYKFSNNYLKLHHFYLKNHVRYMHFFNQIKQAWLANNHFVTLAEIPFDLEQFKNIIKIPYLMLNLSRYSCLLLPIYNFLKDSYQNNNVIKEWFTAFYAFVLYYSLFYKIEGWQKRKTANYNYEAMLQLRLYLSNIYCKNYQLIFKENFNQLYVLLNEMIPCRLLNN